MKVNLLLPIAFLIISCSSDDSNNPNDTPSNVDCIISTTTYYPNENFLYEYSLGKVVALTSNERIVNISYDVGGNLEKYEISEVGNSEVIFRKEFDFDNGNKPVEIRTYDYFIDELIPASKDVYEYENGKIVRINQYDLGTGTYEGKTEYEWDSDNIVSSSFYDGTNTLECTTTYSYNDTESQFYDDFQNFYLLNLNDNDFDEALLFSNNLLKSATNQCSSSTTNYNYSFNNDLINNINVEGNQYLGFGYTCE